MARIELAAQVLDDFDRFFDHMARFGVEDAPAGIAEIIQAVDILSHSPLIGRPVKAGKRELRELRELVIGRDSRAYVALYRYVADIDVVFVLAVRSQRESGFKRRR